MMMKKIILLTILFITSGLFFSYANQDNPDDCASTSELTNPITIVISWLPEPIQNVLEIKIIGYAIWQAIIISAIFFLGIIINRITGSIIKKYSRKLRKSMKKKSFIVDGIFSLKRPLRVLVWTILFRIIALFLIHEHSKGVIWFSDTLLTLSIVIFIYDFVGVLEKYLMKYVIKTETKLDDMLVQIVRNVIRVIVVIIAMLHLYQNISGKNITTIIAGFGLAGMAVAFAAQDSLKNLFGFLIIVIDKPFIIGERIIYGEHDGVIESVGLRSVRLRRSDGDEVTIPNSKAADAVIHNSGRRPHIRRIMNIGITNDTPVEKVEKAIQILQDILKDHEGMNPDKPPRVYFNDFKANSLNIFVIYWYHPPIYFNYLAHSQMVNFQIMHKFNEEGIKFTFTT